MKETTKKKLVITDEGYTAIGIPKKEIVPTLVHALVEAAEDEFGLDINIVATGKKVCDVLIDARRDAMVDILYKIMMELAEDEDDEDDDE